MANRYAHIDGLRAAAVVLVVVAHAGLGGIVPGGSGVTVFFTVSGFIITLLLLKEREKTSAFNLTGFYFRRFIKIFPPFALIVILPTLVWSIWNPVAWEKFAAQIFFMFNWVKIDGDAGVFPGSGVVWSLAIEEQFYILFALIWLLLVRMSWWRAATVALALAVITWSVTSRLILASFGGTTERIYYGTDTRIDGIALGVLVAMFLWSWMQHPKASVATRFLGSDWVILAAIGLYFTSLVIRDPWFRDTFRYTFQSVAAAILILAPFMPGQGWLRRAFISLSSWRPVELVGLASYSIYLAHLSVAIFLWDALSGMALLPRVVLLSTAGVAAGAVVYWLIEVPILAWRKRLEHRPFPTAEARGQDTGL